MYFYESGVEDGPIPPGCVGINKVLKATRSQEITTGSQVILNAAPCWEGRWQCQYGTNPRALVTDVELMKVPDAPTCKLSPIAQR
jgi:hypothetical protein